MSELLYNPERPLKSSFPEKDDFLKSRDAYVEKNQQGILESLGSYFPEEDLEVLTHAAIAVARAQHASAIFIDSVPQHLLEGDYKLTAGWTRLKNVIVGGVCKAFLTINGREHVDIKDIKDDELDEAKVSEVIAAVNISKMLHSIQHAIAYKHHFIARFNATGDQEDYQEIIESDFQEKMEQLFIYVESVIVHELGHALDDIHGNKNKKRLLKSKVHREKELFANLDEKFGVLSGDKKDDYLDSKTERQARLWQNYFMKRYYS